MSPVFLGHPVQSGLCGVTGGKNKLVKDRKRLEGKRKSVGCGAEGVGVVGRLELVLLLVVNVRFNLGADSLLSG